MSSRPIRLQLAHAAEYRALMLEAYAQAPDAFTSTVEERAAMPLSWWAARLSDADDAVEQVMGVMDGQALVGVAGLRREDRTRTAHKATLFGMYVRPAARGRHVGRALVSEVLARARLMPGLRLVQLTVTDTNAAARALYRGCGFVEFGLEPMAVQVSGVYLGKVHMSCDLHAQG